MAESSKARRTAGANGRKRARKTSPVAPAAKSSKRSAATARAAHTPAPAAPRASSLSALERHRMIAEAAYYRAQRRGFVGGNSHQDWLDAEAEIDARLLERPEPR
jgi:hypothetical protein